MTSSRGAGFKKMAVNDRGEGYKKSKFEVTSFVNSPLRVARKVKVSSNTT